MVDIWAAERKKDRQQRFLVILREHNGKPLKEVLAWAEYQLGITRETAFKYLAVFKDIGFVTVEKGVLVLKEIKGGE